MPSSLQHIPHSPHDFKAKIPFREAKTLAMACDGFIKATAQEMK